ncbi:hypothetical protein EFO83_09135 [Lacticaseibacillus rhamnosus]|uniref:helix-turn-helix domain-containing protein n=1 Tax=Lacticaseibacillus rhamnosus TaxID=47715 RepID=UPI0021A67592|nr:helix-turn-helix domain-containing protein [Lacticaseibacillus rhamnosus]MCT3192182.1 hypothetical protein [Lacticaseibacillus rhamnosus]MCT3371268.1 hypothetical protein [Lacticaseibacillus rhamnosus]
MDSQSKWKGYVNLVPYIAAAQSGDSEALQFLINEFSGLCHRHSTTSSHIDYELLHELELQVALATIAFDLHRIQQEVQPVADDFNPEKRFRF